MSNTFWKDVRRFYFFLNIAHDGVLTSKELKMIFPKVLEGTFGMKTNQMTSVTYKDALEAYINRLFSAAYPEYYTSKLNQQQHKQQFFSKMSAEQVQATRGDLPLLLPHFEQDFLFGLSKEEEAVLHIDLKHSINTIEAYYKNIDIAVNQQIDQFLPVLLRALKNTQYVPADANIVDLQVHLDPTTIPENPLEVIEAGQPQIRFHLEVAQLRLLFVGLTAFLYDSHKAKAVQLSFAQPELGTSTNEEHKIANIFSSIPDLLQPGHVVSEVSEANEAQFMLQQMIKSNHEMMVAQRQAAPGAEVDEEGNSIGALPNFDNPLANHLPPTAVGGKLESDQINLLWKYFIYSLSHQPHLATLIASPAASYNPFNARNAVLTTEEEIMANDKTTAKEKEIFLMIHQQQVDTFAKHKASRNLPLVTQFSLRALLNIVFRTYSHTMNISKTVVAINDYIGEVTYGEEEEEDEELANMMRMMMGIPAAFDEEMVVEEADVKKDTTAEDQVEGKKPAHPVTADKEETTKLMNARWLTPIRHSFDWRQPFMVQQLVHTTHGNSLVLGMMDGKNLSMDAMRKNAQVQDEQRVIEGYESFDLAAQMRSGRRY